MKKLARTLAIVDEVAGLPKAIEELATLVAPTLELLRAHEGRTQLFVGGNYPETNQPFFAAHRLMLPGMAKLQTKSRIINMHLLVSRGAIVKVTRADSLLSTLTNGGSYFFVPALEPGEMLVVEVAKE